MTRCDRCNAGQSRPALHRARRRHLCDRCCSVLGVSITEEVRAGVDFLLATEPRGARVAMISDILRGAL